LLLGALVGVIGTALGFLFAFTVSRANLPRGWVRLIDAMTLLPVNVVNQHRRATIQNFLRDGSVAAS